MPGLIFTMNKNWLSIDTITADNDGTITGCARADISSPWFSGHFPGEPILPGIGQISLISEILKKQYPPDVSMWISEVSRLRFRRIVRPDETMYFQIKPDSGKTGSYKFKITVNDELACNGNIIASVSM